MTIYVVAFLNNGQIVITFKLATSKQEAIESVINEKKLKGNIVIEAKQVNPNVSYTW